MTQQLCKLGLKKINVVYRGRSDNPRDKTSRIGYKLDSSKDRCYRKGQRGNVADGGWGSTLYCSYQLSMMNYQSRFHICNSIILILIECCQQF